MTPELCPMRPMSHPFLQTMGRMGRGGLPGIFIIELIRSGLHVDTLCHRDRKVAVSRSSEKIVTFFL